MQVKIVWSEIISGQKKLKVKNFRLKSSVLFAVGKSKKKGPKKNYSVKKIPPPYGGFVDTALIIFYAHRGDRLLGLVSFVAGPGTNVLQ